MKAKRLCILDLLKNKKFLSCIVLPLILGGLLFYPFKTDLGSPRRECSSNLNKSLQFYEIQDFQMDPFMRVIMSVFSVPFDLKYYILSIQDLSEYEGRVDDLGFNFSLYLNGKTIGRGHIPKGKNTKETVYLEKPGRLFLETYYLFYKNNLNCGKTTAHFNAFIRASWPDSISRWILFFISWNFLAILWRDVYNFIKA